jgi:Ser-tRNA(Ala) deacylase AlaX
LGQFAPENEFFTEGEDVKMFVDGEYRSTCAILHSAGHLLDMAVRRAGRTDLKPGKGYHFPTSPYVEYIGAVDAKDR